MGTSSRRERIALTVVRTSSSKPDVVAEMLGRPHAAYTTALEVTDDGYTVKRELEGGFLEVKELSKPAVVTIQTGGNTPRYASIMGIKRARSKPLEEVATGDLGLDESTPKTELIKLYAPVVESAAEMIEGDAETAAGYLAGGDHLHFSMLVNGVFVTPIEWWDQDWIDVTIEDPLTESRFQ